MWLSAATWAIQAVELSTSGSESRTHAKSP